MEKVISKRTPGIVFSPENGTVFRKDPENMKIGQEKVAFGAKYFSGRYLYAEKHTATTTGVVRKNRKKAKVRK